MSQTNSPFAEYFPNIEPDTGNELFWKLFTGEPEAVNGKIDIGRSPGLGIEINEEAARDLAVSLG